MYTWQPLAELRRNVRYGWRLFSRAPGFTAILVFTLALGIGANTAVFSIVQAVLLRPLPFKNSAQLYAVWDEDTTVAAPAKRFDVYRDLEFYKAFSHSFTELAGATWSVGAQVMTGHGPAKEVFAMPVTPNFFSFLGVNAAEGRTFAPEDVNRGCAVVLSHRFWQETLGGQKSLVGGTLRLDDQGCDILGVMPRNFAFVPSDDTDAWTLITPASAIARDPNRHNIGVFGRLRPGVTTAAAASELKVLHKQAHSTDRHAHNNDPKLFPLDEEFTSLAASNLRLSLLVLFAAVIAVLLIACVNAANLLLGRSLRRQKELAIRAALGSGRGRLVRQLLTENLMLAITAAVIGAGLAVAALRYFRALDPVALPPGAVVQVNWPVLAFTAGLCLLTTVVFGFVPACKGSRTDVNEILKANGRGNFGDRGKQRLGRGLVVLEVTLSLVLLAGAGLLIRSVMEFVSTPLGFRTNGIATMSLSLPPVAYPAATQRAVFYQRVMDRLAELPELRGWALTTAVPPTGGNVSGALSVAGRPERENAPNDTREEIVSPQYFHFFQIPLLRGREFTSADSAQTQAVAVVNEALVREYFPREDPIGKQLRFRGLPKTETLVVIGVVGDEKHFSHAQEMSWVASPLIYRSFWQDPPPQIQVLVSGAGDGNRIGALVQKQLASLDPTVPIFRVETLQHFMSHFTAYPRFRAVVLGGFAGLALLLAVIGIYGVLSQLVEQRTQEIGVRVALGAQRSDVVSLVLRSGMLVTGVGICIGLFVAWALTRFLSSLLYGVGATDVLTFAEVSAILAAAAFAAMYLPAKRAAKTDPIKALRHE